ncbi:PhoH family protein [Candidatus Wolfebacteria bacterium]|nr:PhoH family protein [Candidatus Wolfebacteria bacterium]
MENAKKSRQYPEGKNVYFIDTSAILHDWRVLERLSDEENVLVLSIYVLEELDKAKKFQDEKGGNARAASRILDEYRKEGNINKGVKTKRGGFIVVDCNGYEKIFKKQMSGMEKNTDNRIIANAILWKTETSGQYKKIAVVSKDVNLRVKASTFGIDAEDYKNDKSIKNLDELYSGFTIISLSEPELLINLYRGLVSLNNLTRESQRKINSLFPNQCLEINIDGKTALAILKKEKGTLSCVHKPSFAEKKELSPKNNEQALAYELLTDSSLSLIALSGKAGTGKTLISLLAGIDQLGKTYKQIEVYRPNIEIGKELGFLPGTVEEKFNPWIKPIYDNLRLILGNGDFDNQSYSKKTREIIKIRTMISALIIL